MITKNTIALGPKCTKHCKVGDVWVEVWMEPQQDGTFEVVVSKLGATEARIPVVNSTLTFDKCEVLAEAYVRTLESQV